MSLEVGKEEIQSVYDVTRYMRRYIGKERDGEVDLPRFK